MSMSKGPTNMPGMRPRTDADSFLDDKIGAERAKRIQEQRSAKDARDRQTSKELAKKFQKVQEAQFRDERDHLDRSRRVRSREIEGRQQHRQLAEVKERKTAPGALAAAEKKAAALLDEITRIAAQLEKTGDLQQLADLEKVALQANQKMAEGMGELLTLSQRLASAEARVRDLLRQLLSGELGFRLHRDAALTFRSVFAAVTQWPDRIPPGRKPSRESPWGVEEWDAFLGWLNEIPPVPDDLLTEW